VNELTIGLLAILAFGVGLCAYAHFFQLRDQHRSENGGRGG